MDEKQWPLLQSKQQDFNDNGPAAGALCLSCCLLSSDSIIGSVLCCCSQEENSLWKGKRGSPLIRMSPEQQRGRIKEMTSQHHLHKLDQFRAFTYLQLLGEEIQSYRVICNNTLHFSVSINHNVGAAALQSYWNCICIFNCSCIYENERRVGLPIWTPNLQDTRGLDI